MNRLSPLAVWGPHARKRRKQTEKERAQGRCDEKRGAFHFAICGEKVCLGYHPHPSQCPHRQHHLQRARVWGVICSVFASVGWVVWGEQGCPKRGVRCVLADITTSGRKEHCLERSHATSKAQTTQLEPSTSLTRRMRQTRTSLVCQCFHLRNEGRRPPLYKACFGFCISLGAQRTVRQTHQGVRGG